MSLVTALLGSIAGFVIANALVFDVNRTLMGLYQLEQALTIRWQWHTFLLGFVVNLGTLAFMLLTQKNPLKANSRVVFYGSVATVLAAIV